MKAKLILTRFGSNFGTLRFDEKAFLKTLLGFMPYWNFKSTNAVFAESPGVYSSDKILKLSRVDQIEINCDFFDGSIVEVLRQPILYSFNLEKPPGHKYSVKL